MNATLMHFRLTAALTFSLFLASFNATAATLVHSYSDKGEPTGLLGIAGITEESSQRCRSDDFITCRCRWGMLTGTIDSVNYKTGYAIAEGIVVNDGQNAEYVFFGQDWDQSLSEAETSWLPRFLRRGEQVVVFVERCGAAGRNVVAREIYAQRVFSEALSKQTKPRSAQAGSAVQVTSGNGTTWSDHSAWVKELGRDEQIAVIRDIRVRVYRWVNEVISSDAGVKPEATTLLLKQMGMADHMLARLATHAPDLRDALQASADAFLLAFRDGEREKAREAMRRVDALVAAVVATTDKKAADATVLRYEDGLLTTGNSLIIRLRRLANK